MAGNFMAGNFLAGNFLGGYHWVYIVVLLRERGNTYMIKNEVSPMSIYLAYRHFKILVRPEYFLSDLVMKIMKNNGP